MAIQFGVGETPSRFGYHFLVGLQPGISLTEHDKKLLNVLKPAGVIIYRDNFEQNADYQTWLNKYALLVREIRECIERTEVILSIDHEGGRVFRTPAPFTHFACPYCWRDHAKAVGTMMGMQLRSLGINVNYSPLVDINSNPDNPVIGNRSFGSTPEKVIASAAAFIEGIQAEGVYACIKHYPGHGDVSVDSHDALPVIKIGQSLFEKRELAPYARLVQSGIKMVMTAHLMFPNIDPDYPTTMSTRIVKGYLRERFDYKGLITTDDIGMKAISHQYDSPEAIWKTINTTTDLVMICVALTDTARSLDLSNNILDGLSRGKIAEETLFGSYQRINNFLASLSNVEVRELPDALLREHQDYSDRINEMPCGN